MPLERQDQCCGFGGSFAVRYPEISGAMVADKVACVTNTKADVLVSTDTGCLMNIGGDIHRQEKAPARHAPGRAARIPVNHVLVHRQF